jgi:hypothetical protein
MLAIAGWVGSDVPVKLARLVVYGALCCTSTRLVAAQDAPSDAGVVDLDLRFEQLERNAQGPSHAEDAVDSSDEQRLEESSERTPEAADVIGFGDEPHLDASAERAPDDADTVGFGDESFEQSTQPASASAVPDSRQFALGATLRLQTASRVSSGRFAKARQLLDVRFEARRELGNGARLRVYAAGHTEVDYLLLANMDEYDRETFDVYAWQVRPREVYLAFEWSAIELRVGEQIVNLGQAEVLSVLDVINPRDLREPLSTEPEDMRLPVLMSRLSMAIDRTRIEVIAVHEPYFGLLPPPLGEFSPLRQFILEDPTLGPALEDRTMRNLHVPPHALFDLDATQFHARVNWSGPSVDLSIQASDLLDRAGVPSLPPATEFEKDTIDVPIAHPRYALFGHSGAYTLGPCILRWELAYEHRRPVTVRTLDSSLMIWSLARTSALSGMLGVTYAPSATTNVALELSQTYRLEALPVGTALLFPLDLPQFALRASQMLLRDRLTISGVALLVGLAPVNAWAARIEVRYAITDDVEAALGFTSYQPNRHFGMFYGFEHNDRLFFNLRWNVSQ